MFDHMKIPAHRGCNLHLNPSSEQIRARIQNPRELQPAGGDRP